MVKCKCGSSMFVYPGHITKSGEQPYYFRCSDKKYKKTDCDASWLPVKQVEEKFINTLREISLNKSLLSTYINNNIDVNFDILIENIKKEISKKNKDIEKLTDKLILIEGPAIDIITNKINSLSADITKLNDELFILERKKIFQAQDQINIETLHKLILEFIENFDLLIIEDKQRTVKRVLKEIRYDGKKKITIVFLGGI